MSGPFEDDEQHARWRRNLAESEAALVACKGQDVGVVARARQTWTAQVLELIEATLTGRPAGDVVEAVSYELLSAADQRGFAGLELLIDLIHDRVPSGDLEGTPVNQESTQLLIRCLRNVLDWQLAYHESVLGQKRGRAQDSGRASRATLDGLLVMSGIRDRWWHSWPAFERMTRELQRELNSIGKPLLSASEGLPERVELDADDVISLARGALKLTIYRTYVRSMNVKQRKRAGLPRAAVAELEMLDRGSEGLCAFDIDELHSVSRVSLSKTMTFLSLLSLSRDDISTAIAERPKDSHFSDRHPLRFKPFMMLGSSLVLLPGPFHLVSAVERLIETQHTAEGEASTTQFYAARGRALETYTADMLEDMLGWTTASAINWWSSAAHGEVDVAANGHDVSILVECKSKGRPRRRLQDLVDFASEQLARPLAQQPEDLYTKIEGQAGTDSLMVLRDVLAATARIRLVILAYDLEARTTAIPPYISVSGKEVYAPLFLSVPDLELIKTTFTKELSRQYLVDRFLFRSDPILAQIDEEMLISMFLEHGFSHRAEDFLRGRTAAATIQGRFGRAVGTFAYRNVWSIFGARPPVKLALTPSSGSAARFRDAARHYDGPTWYMATLVADLIAGSPDFARELAEADSAVLESRNLQMMGPWQLEVPGSDAALQVILTAGPWTREEFSRLESKPLDEADTNFLQRRATQANPRARYGEIQLYWASRLQRMALKSLGDLGALFDPARRSWEGRTFRPVDQVLNPAQQCWCGSTLLLGDCEPSHW